MLFGVVPLSLIDSSLQLIMSKDQSLALVPAVLLLDLRSEDLQFRLTGESNETRGLPRCGLCLALRLNWCARTYGCCVVGVLSALWHGNPNDWHWAEISTSLLNAREDAVTGAMFSLHA